MDDGPQVHFFGGHQGKSPGNIKLHLITKNTEGAGAGTVAFFHTFIQNVPHELVVLVHWLGI